jgi:TolB protein
MAVAAPAVAQERPNVVVTPGSQQSFKLALQTFADSTAVPEPARAERFREQIGRALEFSGVFEIVPRTAFLGPERSSTLDGVSILCSDWTQIGADALVEGVMRVDGELTVEFRAWDTARCQRVEGKRYTQPASADASILAKRIADDIVAAFTGLRGVASTELTFVSSRGGNPEVFVMSADGSHQRAATSNRSINNFPSWSPDGNSIVYTSYRHRNRPLLFISTRGQGRPGRLLPRLGDERSEYRGVFDPRGERLALSMSNPGEAAEIYVVQPGGGGLVRLTRNRSIDIAPVWSPDGRQMAFVSDRAGSPQVYLMDADGRNQRRLTYQGSYNTAPAWSPDGAWIAYETRVGGQFDIWLIDPEGSVNVPVVTHPRSDESPSWAPNSRKLAFSSRRRGRADVYVMDVNGDNLLRLTQDSGDNTSPSWGPFPR